MVNNIAKEIPTISSLTANNLKRFELVLYPIMLITIGITLINLSFSLAT